MLHHVIRYVMERRMMISFQLFPGTAVFFTRKLANAYVAYSAPYFSFVLVRDGLRKWTPWKTLDYRYAPDWSGPNGPDKLFLCGLGAAVGLSSVFHWAEWPQMRGAMVMDILVRRRLLLFSVLTAT